MGDDCDLDCNCDCFESNECDCHYCGECCAETCFLINCRRLFECCCWCCPCVNEARGVSYWWLYCPRLTRHCCHRRTQDNAAIRRMKDLLYEEVGQKHPAPVLAQPSSKLKSPSAGSEEPNSHMDGSVEVNMDQTELASVALNETGSDATALNNDECVGVTLQKPPPPSYEIAVSDNKI